MTIRMPWLALVGAALAIVVALSPALGVALQLDRAAVVDGEYWRLLTGHFAHWSASHFAWDTVAFLSCGAIVELHSRRRFVATIVGSALAVAVVVLAFAPDLGFYRGLSGIDSALFVVVIAILGQRAWAARSWLADAILVAAGFGFAAKTAAELVGGRGLFIHPDPDFVVMPMAHFVGAAVGIGIALARASPGKSLQSSV